MSGSLSAMTVSGQPISPVVRSLKTCPGSRFPDSPIPGTNNKEIQRQRMEENLYDLVSRMELESGTGAKWRDKGTKWDKDGQGV